MANIGRHRVLMDREVTLASVTDALAARSRALQEYEENQSFREQQQFESLKTSMSPRLYDQELASITEKRCQNTGNWLDNDTAFRSWSNTNARSVPVLWLSGIPGAGKTYLTAHAIDRAMDKGQHVAFAFLSYKNIETATKLSVLHSIMFQLLQDHRHLRPALINAYQSHRRQLQSLAKYVGDILCNILSSIEGTIFFVVDGLDEIDQIERQDLLKILLNLLNSCPNLRILISSRAETDISRFMKDKAESVQIGGKNQQDIELYVNEKFKELKDLDLSTVEEITRLTQEIPKKAEGMFLYARLVIDSLKRLARLNDLREELQNLPNGLNEAYGRIITRIEQLESPMRSDAISILRWVCCAKNPIRKEELELALTVRPGDGTLDRQNKFLRSMFETCGPIIEMQGEYVVFVHYTVKEFLFNQQSQYFIREAAAHRHIASICMSYLSFDCFNPDIKDSAIDDYILSGEYVLLGYAESHWLGHVKDGVRDFSGSSSVDELCRLILEFADARENPGYVSITKSGRIVAVAPLPFRRQWPAVYEWLQKMDTLAGMGQQQLASTDGRHWSNKEPLLLTDTSRQIRRQFNALVDACCTSRTHANDCYCATLQKYYGPQLFKCTKPACKFFRIGFASNAERQRHVKVHERYFKCSMSHCDFFVMGFFSRRELDQHMQDCHPKDESLSNMPLPGQACRALDHSDLERALLDAVEKGEAIYVRSLLDRIAHPPIVTLVKVAMRNTSPDVLELLLTNGPKIWLNREGVNYDTSPDMVQLLLEHGADTESTQVLRQVIQFSPLEHTTGRESNALLLAQLLLNNGVVDLDGSVTSLAPLAGIAGWRGNQSAEIARLLLGFGAGIDSQSGRHKTTALLLAAENTSRRAAQFMKFLLENGADHTIKNNIGRTARFYVGARRIQKWLDVTWDELVESAREAREERERRGA